MKRYQLYVKMHGRWEWLCAIEADSHAEALRRAVTCLEPVHYDKAIRLEQEDPPEERKPN